MPDISFDDLIPKGGGGRTSTEEPTFDDLIPQDQQIQGLLRYPAMAGSYLARGAAQGIGAIGDLQDLLQRGVNIPADAVARALGATPPSGSPQSNLSSNRLIGYGKASGIIDRADLQPQNTGERYLAATAEGVGGMLPFAPLGGGNLAANMVRAGVQGMGAGAGGEAAAELFPNHPTLARLSGNILGAMGGGAAFNAGNRLAGAAMGTTSPTVQAYRQLGIEPSLVGDVSGSPTLQMVQAYAAKAPGGAGRVRDVSERTIGQWGQALEDTAANYGTARTMQEAGNVLQLNGKQWLKQWKDASRNSWNNVDMHIPGNTDVPIPNYAATISEMRERLPTAQETAKVIGRPFSASLESALTRDLWNSAIRAGRTPDLNSPPSLTWKDVKSIRSAIGERLDDPQIVSDIGHTELKRIYGALSEDMKAAAAARGPEAKAAFSSASGLTKNGHDFIEGILSKIIPGNEITPERAASSLLSGVGAGGTTLDAVRREMPQAADELAAFKLRDMALANPGQQSASATRLSPGTFVTDYAKLSPEAAAALFSGDPRVQALSSVGDSMRQTERMLNTSNTGTYQAMRDALGALVPGGAIAGAYAGNGPGAVLGAAGTAIAPWLTGYGAARFSTSPALASLLSSQAAALPSAGLYNRAAIIPPALRALLPGVGGQQ